jgi:hypothetical protein
MTYKDRQKPSYEQVEVLGRHVAGMCRVRGDCPKAILGPGARVPERLGYCNHRHVENQGVSSPRN